MSTRRPGRAPDLWPGQLRRRSLDHGDLIGSGIATGVARAQQHRQRLPGPAAAVVDEGAEWMKSIAALERRRRMLRVRGDQGGVGVDDQP
jgi:hypothetical protein